MTQQKYLSARNALAWLNVYKMDIFFKGTNKYYFDS